MTRERVHQIKFRPDMSLKELAKEMAKTGVLGGGSFGKASYLLSKILKDKDYTVFLSLSGPLIPSGMRNIFSKLIEEKYVDVVITSGANIVHDLIETFGHRHYQGSFNLDDSKLSKKKEGRIGNIIVKEEAFKTLEDKLKELFLDIPSLSDKITPSELVYEIGKRIDDKSSILYQAAKNDVQIHSPGLLDSMLGLHLWLFSQRNKVNLDVLGDMSKLSSIVYDSKKTAAIILGGGLPKHYTLASNILRGGLDAAMQITTARVEDGSLSGATLDEAISWNKLKSSDKLNNVTIRGDVTIIFPLLLKTVLE
ncbi:MAG: deoxyhypusine synthase [Candidatus Ranarchaeia archaeon]